MEGVLQGILDLAKLYLLIGVIAPCLAGVVGILCVVAFLWWANRK